jgi:hypothetical protein
LLRGIQYLILVQDQGTTFFLAGDTSYDERLMLAGRIDDVSALAGATLGAIRVSRPGSSDRRGAFMMLHVHTKCEG